MEKVNFQQSLKNIPAPENKIYEELLIIAIGNTVKAFQNKANAFKNKYKNKKETNTRLSCSLVASGCKDGTSANTRETRVTHYW